MKKKITKKSVTKNTQCCNKNSCESCGFYGLGFIGAAIYYISTATGFWMGILGVLKALV